MSAVSRNVTPSSIAASTTARVPATSVRRPKLLQPRPAIEACTPELPSGRVGRERAVIRCRLVRLFLASYDPVVVRAQRVGEPLGHRCVIALLPQRRHDQLVTVGSADVDQARTLQVTDEDRAAFTGLDSTGGVGARDARSD